MFRFLLTEHSIFTAKTPSKVKACSASKFKFSGTILSRVKVKQKRKHDNYFSILTFNICNKTCDQMVTLFE